MDAASGRPLAWLPAGLTSLILSLERTDSLALQLKAFSVSHAVKALLSVKRNSSPKEHLWSSHRSASLDAALRELAKPLDAAGLYSSPNICSCEEFCECSDCESCVSEEEFEEFEEHELHYQWGFPLAGSLILNGPGSYPPKGAADACFQGRRDSRLPRFGSKRVQGFSWASPLKRLAAVEGKEFVESASGGGGGGADSAQDSKDSRSTSVAPRQSLESEEVEKSAGISVPKKKKVEVALPSISRGSEEKQTDRESQQDDVKQISESLSQRIDRGSDSQRDHDVKDDITSSCQSAPSRGPKWNFRMGQNAGAGALAGGVVSLCLHPIDTLKTIVQAQTGGSRNLLPILSSIISERGLKGLYRGLGSNMTSSAPISAIYTLTYEAVKAGLLRHIPEDMSAFAHCAAGGCASVATSIVYTPSECVKQQMQVNGLYQNSWQAFTSILKQGGLPMLYKGWGAVLCRNVPQSVIKFYTYEGLKLWAQGGQPRDTPLTTLQALAIGGVAGSTAAFFTTPFDVVKTRLQTQIPGSVQQYNGVIHAFQSIATTEGVAGLYRGLVPRLVIYVTQGALFFASYEFIKHVLAVEVPRLRIKTSQIEGYQRQPAPIPAEST